MIKKNLFYTTLLILSVFFFGCAAQKQKPLYHWGNYSDSLYHAKKNPGEKSVMAHKEVLENIINESEKRNLRVPPGVYAELGYIYALLNNTKEAIRLFGLEKQTYPESTILMERLIQQSEKRAAEGSAEGGKLSIEVEIEKETAIGGTDSD